MIHFSLFSGIGGFDLASEWAGWKNYLSCEINEFGNKVLNHYWPEAYHHTDIKTLTYDTINAELSKRFGTEWRNDDIIISGGFPCQPFSTAGKRLGKEDERHLWPEMLRVIREVRPKYVVGENVRGLLSWSDGLVLEEVYADLEGEGYEVQPFILPAVGIGAPHKRDRLYIIATNTKCQRREEWGQDNGWQNKEEIGAGLYNRAERSGNDGNATNTNNEGLQRGSDQREDRGEKSFGTSDRRGNTSRILRTSWENFPTQSPVCSRDDGFSPKLDGITFSKWRNESIKGYGNAVVPQLVYRIFDTINKIEDEK